MVSIDHVNTGLVYKGMGLVRAVGTKKDCLNREVQQAMRELTEEETRTLFDKLALYIGRNIKELIDNPEDAHCFRMQSYRVYYMR